MSYQRFWSRVDKFGECWIWTGPVRSYGAGKVIVRVDGKWRDVSAHRFAWELEHGAVPGGMKVVQMCGNPRCVRHLQLSQSRITKIQSRHLGKPLPDRHPDISDTHWSLFVRHVQNSESYDALAVEMQMPLTTVRAIVERVSTRTSKGPPPLAPQPVSDQPAGVTDRDWSIYCRHIHDGESQAAIGRDIGITRERVRQIIRSIDS